MFSTTIKSHYGVSAIIELARNYNKGLVQIKDIVSRRNIPKTYLEQIFNRLNKHGLITSVRGNKGGYQLSDDPANITLLAVLEALEGEIELRKYPGIKIVQELFTEIEDKARKILDISLAELVLREQKYKDQVMFHI